MTITIPDLSLVVLIGASGSGKSTFAARHFLPTEILSSDFCRAVVSDNENEQSVTNDAFEVLHYIAAKRLAHRRMVVVDATNVQPEGRRQLIDLARRYHVVPVAIVLNLPERVCRDRHQKRGDRSFPEAVISRQCMQLRRSMRYLERDGFRRVIELNSEEAVDAVTIQREPLWVDRRTLHGPFDIIGDVHGCCDELETLLGSLGYVREPAPAETIASMLPTFRHPEGRTAVFVGDLVDRGPRNLDAIELVRAMVAAGTALCVPGNHDVKFMRALRGRNVQVRHGLECTLAEVEALPEQGKAEYTKGLADFIDSLVSHYVLDEGRLVVAHAGMKEQLQGRASREVRDFALFGETTGEIDEFGLPVRHNWAADYRGAARVVYGHTPVPRAEWVNRTIDIDTGCVFGGALTALRYPEMELVSVPAARTYCEPVRPLAPEHSDRSSQHLADDLLVLNDFIGKRLVETRLAGRVLVPAENGAAALEVLSRFTVDPRWLLYIPPTMSPAETTRREGYLEHPDEAFAYYRSNGVRRVMCQEKHMGSRAVVVVFRDAAAARKRLGTVDDRDGICYTRTGRAFFSDDAMERELLARLRGNLDASGFWDAFNSSFAVLDCELMPWSVKARALLEGQYASVGAAARHGLDAAGALVRQALGRLSAAEPLAAQIGVRSDMARRYVDAYRRYCWPVVQVDDLRLAPFHLLATDGELHTNRDHGWHMQTIARYAVRGEEPTVMATAHAEVDLDDEASVGQAVSWWEELTSAGGEGMVVKPFEFIAQGEKGTLQPAIKCRGVEYLRIIYGPEYSAPEHLERLRARSVKSKRAMALREFALGIEGLERFVKGESLYRTHECVHAVLAMESEPVDPRL